MIIRSGYAVRIGMLIVLGWCSLAGHAQVRKVWALGDGEKVFRDDLKHPASNGNFTWDGKSIHLKGLYNEVLAFQVIVEVGSDTVRGIEMSVDYPMPEDAGQAIGASTLAHGPQGYLEVFTEHYLQVKDSTHPNWFYGSRAAAPEHMTGWIPDALIPANAISGRGGFPVTIAPLRNQGFWVDVELPRDQEHLRPGKYRSVVRVTENGKTIWSIPLEITLLPSYLPEEDQSVIWAFSSDAASYFPEFSTEQVDDMLKFEAHRHRITLTGGFRPQISAFNSEDLASYQKYLDGTAYTPSHGYHGPAEGKGEAIFPIGTYGAPVMGETRAAVQEQSNQWADWFKIHAPATTYFWYITDEPDSARLVWVNERARWVHENPGTGRKLPLFTTTAYKPSLASAIDIWAAYDGVDLEALPVIRKRGGDHWFYNGNRPRYGSVILEGAAVDFRVNSWIMYKYDLRTHFIWHSTAWKHNGQGPKAHLHQNVFQNPLTFINSDFDFGNGDGILFYPGHMPYYPEEDRGLNRVLPSIRLKNIRRGQQDAALLHLVEQKVGREKVLALVNRVVPRAMSELPMKNPVPWSQRGDDYDKIRELLLELLR